jgi:hypothetical protein
MSPNQIVNVRRNPREVIGKVWRWNTKTNQLIQWME